MIAAVFTPMDKQGRVDLTVIGRYAARIASSPVQGVFVCGTTGEFASLTVRERKEVLEQWIAAAAGRFKVIAHVGHDCRLEAEELARHAAQAGADGVAAIAPSFFKPAAVGDLVDFFVSVAQAAAELPFYYYHMPSITGVCLPVDRFLAEGRKRIPNLAGTKFTHNDLMEMGACLDLDGGAFEVLHGFDEMLAAGLAMGAVAGVGSTYNYLPGVYNGIFEAMERGDLKRARAWQMHSIRTVEILVRYGGGVRAGKAVMNLAGIACGDCRAPIRPFSADEYRQLQEDLQRIGFPGFGETEETPEDKKWE